MTVMDLEDRSATEAFLADLDSEWDSVFLAGMGAADVGDVEGLRACADMLNSIGFALEETRQALKSGVLPF